MKKVLVVDWLDQYGGAERVITSLCTIFSFQKCYALIHIMKEQNVDKLFASGKIPVLETKLRIFRSKFRYLFPFFQNYIRTLKVDKDVDIIISSSHAVAKGILKSNENQIHFSYFQARNLKYLWDDYDLYFGKVRYLMNPFKKHLRKQDVLSAQQPDYIISNSKFVQQWVKKTYHRDSEVIYPPVAISKFQLCSEKEDYFIAVGRIEPYKRFDIIVDCFNSNGKKLIMVGDGSQLPQLKKKANKNIHFTGFLNSDEVFQHLRKAKGFIHAGVEDFGIAPIEAQACGTPVIAFEAGGILETVLKGKTGVFFKEHSKESLEEAIAYFETIKFNYEEIRKHAERFSTSNYEIAMQKYIEEKVIEHTNRMEN